MLQALAGVAHGRELSPRTQEASDPDGDKYTTAPLPEHAEVDAPIIAVPETLPAASYAALPSVYEVPHVRPLKEKIVETDVPTWLPFRKSRYPATPTLSLEAAQESVIEDCPTFDGVSCDGVVGGAVSPAHACVCPVSVAVPETWLVTSTAVAPSV